MLIKYQRIPSKPKSKTRASHENFVLHIKSRLKLLIIPTIHRTFRYRVVKSQLIFSILNHHNSLTQIHISDQVEPTELENTRTAKQM